MSSSSHRQRQLSLITPRDNHSHGCITQKKKPSISIEDSKKKAITPETTHKHRPISKGNRIALEQVVVNQRKKTTFDKQRLVVREEKHEVREKKIVSYYTPVEKEKKRIPHKHKSGGTLEVTFKIKF